jgi:putative YphP/YqiW family bacilliredoxin
MPYDPVMVQPMREELSEVGFKDLMNADDVADFFSEKSGTAFLVINSVCGCAAGMARPSVKIALEHAAKKPARLAAVFAGQEVEATNAARAQFADYPPSSPSMVLFKDGEVAHFVPRHAIEGRAAQEIAAELAEAFEKFCN